MRALFQWLGALTVTAAAAVSLLGAARVFAGSAVPVTAEGFVVVVDAGHGGADGGAVGQETGIVEAELNLSVARLLEEALTGRGIKVIMTRTDGDALDDTKKKDMARRRNILRDPSADLVVSVHMNKFSDRQVAGAMAYYMKGSVQGELLAGKVIDSICTAAGQKKRLPNPGDYFVLRECAATAVLVECGFLSNPEEEGLLQDPAYQALLAEAVADGVVSYLTEHAGQ